MELPFSGIIQKLRAFHRRQRDAARRRSLCVRCEFVLLCVTENKRAVLEHVIAYKDVDTECQMGKRARPHIYPGITWTELGKKIGEEILEPWPYRNGKKTF